MANKIVLKKSSVVSKVPLAADLDIGELSVNLADQKLYSKNSSGTVILVGSGLGGSGDVQGPASSTDNALVRFSGTNGKVLKNSTATLDDSGNLTVLTSKSTGTGADKMAVGTTAQRPTGQAGLFRFNSDLNNPEWYDSASSVWRKFSDSRTYDIEYLVVAGGGGGGYEIGGGGGAGGLLNSTMTLTIGTAYTVTVGAGGAGGTTLGSAGGNGGNSVFGSVTAIGGGGGAPNASISGGNGGSGGGAGEGYGIYGLGTSGQGNNGGDAYNAGAYGSGGGGGKGAVGQSGDSSKGGDGGSGGLYSDWATATSSGASGYYAGGGGAGTYSSGTDGIGGAGGGGTAGSTAGTANTGGGGGGGSYRYTRNGANGGSGIVIIRYLGSQRGTGGTVYSSGGYTYHKFTASGTFTA